MHEVSGKRRQVLYLPDLTVFTIKLPVKQTIAGAVRGVPKRSKSFRQELMQAWVL